MAKFRGKDVCFSPKFVFTPDESDATATAADIAQGKTAYVDNVKITGTMATPSGNQNIDTLDEYNVTTKATARVSAAERDKFIAGNIKDGVALLGVTGDYTGVTPTGNVDIETLNEYNVSGKATARISSAERAKIIPANIAYGVTMLGVTGTHQGGGGVPPYLTFSSPSNFTIATKNTAKNWDGVLYYSTDAQTWAVWDGTNTLSSANGKLYMYGVGNTKITGILNFSLNACSFVFTGFDISCDGDIRCLLDYTKSVLNIDPAMADYALCGLFADNSSIIKSPELPITTLSSYCYGSMFEGCTNLTTAPTLPATTLAISCYLRMFVGCTNLTTAPALPATTLAISCYFRMFEGCTNLTTAPALPATTLAAMSGALSGCYGQMFKNCTSLTNAPALPATTLESRCYEQMFYGCASLITAPTLPATTLASSCYSQMFEGCTNLTAAPILPATTLASSCYSRMFYGCVELIKIPTLVAIIISDGAYRNMFNGCSKIKLSETQTGEYIFAFRMPESGTGALGTNSLDDMFTSTGGTFTGTPAINTTYYTSNEIIS